MDIFNLESSRLLLQTAYCLSQQRQFKPCGLKGSVYLMFPNKFEINVGNYPPFSGNQPYPIKAQKTWSNMVKLSLETPLSNLVKPSFNNHSTTSNLVQMKHIIKSNLKPTKPLLHHMVSLWLRPSPKKHKAGVTALHQGGQAGGAR